MRCLIVLILTFSFCRPIFAEPPRCDVATGRKGVVSSDSAIASEVGRDVLAGGGNAVDAAVAIAFALAVTWPEAGNIGGGGFMLVAPPGDEPVRCIDYRETAPAAATVDSFRNWKQRQHARMAGVPGTVRGLQEAHRLYGSLTWRDLITPSIELARDGFQVDKSLADSLNGVLSDARTTDRHSELRRVYGQPDAREWQAGDKMRLPQLSATLAMISRNPDAFYKGPISLMIQAEMVNGDGLITRDDLRSYRAVVRKPTVGSFGRFTLYGAPPPSSGGVCVLMQLQMLEQLGFADIGDATWSPNQGHVLAEVMRRAFRERAAHLGDPAYVSRPAAAFTAERADDLAASVNRDEATPSDAIAGDIPLAPPSPESEETTHFSVVDADGMAVSNTYTLEASFGSRVVVRGAGFLLNNEMGDFNWVPDGTNRLGRIGTPPNLVAPGKRMLSSQSPTIIKEGGRVRLVVGSPGGRTIINTVTQVITHHLLRDRPLNEAVRRPRMHHQWFPDVLFLAGAEEEWPTGFADALRDKGHIVQHRDGYRQGSVHAIAVSEDGVAEAVADWRRGGAARAVE